MSSIGPPGLVQISWGRCDPEQRLAFRGGRFTSVNTVCSLLPAALLTTGFYFALIPLHGTWLHTTFTQRGFVPYAIVALFFWSLAMLGMKFLKLRLQARALRLQLVPEHPEWVLSPLTVHEVQQRMYELVDEPRHFTLLNRIAIALANLRNLGRVSDVDDILRSQAAQDESVMQTSYSLLNVFVWAMPVLGFIGTVQGLSQAIGSFGEVLATTSVLSEIKTSLPSVTAGLSVAFETTLQGLLAALTVQMLLSWLRKAEEEFLAACSEYSLRHIVGRLRLIPLEAESEG